MLKHSESSPSDFRWISFTCWGGAWAWFPSAGTLGFNSLGSAGTFGVNWFGSAAAGAGFALA